MTVSVCLCECKDQWSGGAISSKNREKYDQKMY